MLNREEFDVLFYSIKKKKYEDPLPDIVQSPDELWWVFSHVQNIHPKVILEIGTERGGTSWFWEKALGTDGLLITIDLKLQERTPTNFCDFSNARPKILFKEANSQLMGTVLSVQEDLRGKEVDFLYIDGDHSYEGVKKDYELWTTLVRENGLVAFHDTNYPPIRQMLDEKNHPRLEYMDRGFGTGLIKGW